MRAISLFFQPTGTNLKKFGLDIAEEKTHIINFTQNYNTKHKEKGTVKVKDKEIQEGDKTKFLGITLDKKLNYDEHINNITEKSKRRLDMLRYIGHVRKGANPKTMIILYKALVRSVTDYGIQIYGGNNGKVRERIQKIHNAGIRAAMGYRMSTPTNVMTVEAGIMDSDNRRMIIKHRATDSSEVLVALETYAREMRNPVVEIEGRDELLDVWRETGDIE